MQIREFIAWARGVGLPADAADPNTAIHDVATADPTALKEALNLRGGLGIGEATRISRELGKIDQVAPETREGFLTRLLRPLELRDRVDLAGGNPLPAALSLVQRLAASEHPMTLSQRAAMNGVLEDLPAVIASPDAVNLKRREELREDLRILTALVSPSYRLEGYYFSQTEGTTLSSATSYIVSEEKKKKTADAPVMRHQLNPSYGPSHNFAPIFTMIDRILADPRNEETKRREPQQVAGARLDRAAANRLSAFRTTLSSAHSMGFVLSTQLPRIETDLRWMRHALHNTEYSDQLARETAALSGLLVKQPAATSGGVLSNLGTNLSVLLLAAKMMFGIQTQEEPSFASLNIAPSISETVQELDLSQVNGVASRGHVDTVTHHHRPGHASTSHLAPARTGAASRVLLARA